MSEPIKITATVAAWFTNPESAYSRAELNRAIEKQDGVGVINALHFYAAPGASGPASWVCMGEADITLRLIGGDEITRKAVDVLNAKLDELRAAYLTKQQEIMRQISELQAITNEVAA